MKETFLSWGKYFIMKSGKCLYFYSDKVVNIKQSRKKKSEKKTRELCLIMAALIAQLVKGSFQNLKYEFKCDSKLNLFKFPIRFNGQRENKLK